jgi:hypothetical protein
MPPTHGLTDGAQTLPAAAGCHVDDDGRVGLVLLTFQTMAICQWRQDSATVNDGIHFLTLAVAPRCVPDVCQALKGCVHGSVR